MKSNSNINYTIIFSGYNLELFFDVLLTVYLSIFISVFNQLDGRLVHVTATYRCDDTRGCVMQFWPPDDEHMCSKHVEAWNKTYRETNFVHQVG